METSFNVFRYVLKLKVKNLQDNLNVFKNKILFLKERSAKVFAQENGLQWTENGTAKVRMQQVLTAIKILG